MKYIKNLSYADVSTYVDMPFIGTINGLSIMSEYKYGKALLITTDTGALSLNTPNVSIKLPYSFFSTILENTYTSSYFIDPEHVDADTSIALNTIANSYPSVFQYVRNDIIMTPNSAIGLDVDSLLAISDGVYLTSDNTEFITGSANITLSSDIRLCDDILYVLNIALTALGKEEVTAEELEQVDAEGGAAYFNLNDSDRMTGVTCIVPEPYRPIGFTNLAYVNNFISGKANVVISKPIIELANNEATFSFLKNPYVTIDILDQMLYEAYGVSTFKSFVTGNVAKIFDIINQEDIKLIGVYNGFIFGFVTLNTTYFVNAIGYYMYLMMAITLENPSDSDDNTTEE